MGLTITFRYKLEYSKSAEYVLLFFLEETKVRQNGMDGRRRGIGEAGRDVNRAIMRIRKGVCQFLDDERNTYY